MRAHLDGNQREEIPHNNCPTDQMPATSSHRTGISICSIPSVSRPTALPEDSALDTASGHATLGPPLPGALVAESPTRCASTWMAASCKAAGTTPSHSASARPWPWPAPSPPPSRAGDLNRDCLRWASASGTARIELANQLGAEHLLTKNTRLAESDPSKPLSSTASATCNASAAAPRPPPASDRRRPAAPPAEPPRPRPAGSTAAAGAAAPSPPPGR